jgi:regulatory protein
MPIVTSITSQKNKKRVNVYLDFKFGFGIDLENFVLSGIKLNKEYKEEEIEKIIKKAEFQKTFDKLLKFAMLRPRSEKEIEDYFRRKKIHESMHEELIGKLTHLELLDDAKFAAWWIEQRKTFKPKGKRALESELRQKGIGKEIISTALSDSPINEEKIAKELLNRNAYKWARYQGREKKQKMSQFLARKGFGWDIISKITKIDLDS